MIYIEAARGKRPKTIPIVIEIQMAVCPGFKKLVARYGFSEICKNAELSAQCTVMPVNDLGVDAAIHMSDLLIPIEAMGVEVEYTLEGPRIEKPLRTRSDVEKLSIPDPEMGMRVWLEALRMAKKELSGTVPLMGWIGGPLSTASFLVEGRVPSNSPPFHHTKTMMYSDPGTFHLLLSKLTGMYAHFIPAQAEAGADTMMILDLKAPAAMSSEDYNAFSLPYLRELVNAARLTNMPLLFAADGTSFLDTAIATLGIDIIGLDWTISMGDAIRKLGPAQVVQGNLEPYCLFAPDAVIERKVREIVEAGKAAPAHIFSLGGWVVMETPFEKVKYLVDLVHSM